MGYSYDFFTFIYNTVLLFSFFFTRVEFFFAFRKNCYNFRVLA
jgi:hypothetical protein